MKKMNGFYGNVILLPRLDLEIFLAHRAAMTVCKRLKRDFFSNRCVYREN